MWLDDFNDSAHNATGFDTNTSVLQNKQTDRSRQIVPMFIKHMNLMSDDLTFFGQTITIVEFFGILRTQTISSTKVIYELEDWGGRIICHLWLDHDADQAPEIPDLKLNYYCRVVGTLKSLSEGRRVVVLKIEKMSHPNEQITFMLSAVCARLEIEKVYKEEIQNKNTSICTNVAATTSTHDSNNMIGTSFQLNVYKIIEKYSDQPNGANFEQILGLVKCSKAELINSLEFLGNEGHVYTTVDDNHYKVAN